MVLNYLNKKVFSTGKQVAKSAFNSVQNEVKEFSKTLKEQREYNNFRKRYFQQSGSELVGVDYFQPVSVEVKNDVLYRLRLPEYTYDPICNLSQIKPVTSVEDGLYVLETHDFGTTKTFLRTTNKPVISAIVDYYKTIDDKI